MDKRFNIEHTPEHIHVTFDHPHRVLSSAVLNGGLVQAAHIVNLKVPKNPPHPDELDPPAVHIQKHCRAKGLSGLCVGMMTSASLNSMRTAAIRDRGIEITTIVTAGISNLRRAGDPADYQETPANKSIQGTINTVSICNVALTETALVEAIMISAEAKAAALQGLALKSPVSNNTATGTGTDAIALACGTAGPKITYAGKHTRFGELLAKTVIESTTAAVLYADRKGK